MARTRRNRLRLADGDASPANGGQHLAKPVINRRARAIEKSCS
jgi:hypothetical protein